jgi:hypothetical protein
MAVLSFVTIQNMVLEDAFPESKRTDVKAWIVDAHTEIWDAADYTFKSVLATVTVVNGVLTGASDIADVYALYDNTGCPLQGYYDPARFYEQYNSNISGTGSVPEAFLILGNAIIVKPSTTGTLSNFQVVYRKVKPTLSADSDLSGLPDGYDTALVYGAKRLGFTQINNPFADDFATLFNQKKAALQEAYTYGIEESGLQAPAYRPGM